MDEMGEMKAGQNNVPDDVPEPDPKGCEHQAVSIVTSRIV